MHGSRRRNRSRRNRSRRVSGLAFGLATLGLDGCLGDDDALGHATTGRDRGREGQDRGSLEVHDAKRKKAWVGGCFAWGLKVIEGRRSRMQASGTELRPRLYTCWCLSIDFLFPVTFGPAVVSLFVISNPHPESQTVCCLKLLSSTRALRSRGCPLPACSVEKVERVVECRVLERCRCSCGDAQECARDRERKSICLR